MVAEVLGKEISKSKKMLELYNGGMEIGEIAKVMGVRYNFVYNVVSNNCMKEGVEIRVNKKRGEVKNRVIELLEAGKEVKEISGELGVLYNYVWKIRKEWELNKG